MSTSDERPVSPWQWLRPALAAGVAVLAGIAYGLLTRVAFGSSEFSDL